MNLQTIFQIDVSLALIIVLAIIQYLWIHKGNKKPKREQFTNYEEKSVNERGREQIQQLLSKRLTPPISI